jgi:DNA-3-methyladenine glycosylase I
LWGFVDGQTIRHSFRTIRQIPAESKESRAMSKALRERGFAFVGPTICYAFMQAVGMVDDHLVSCFRRTG